MVVVAGLLNIVALIVAIVGAALDNSRVIGSAVILLALGGIIVGGLVRTYAVKVQDRVIRIEMRLRLAKILPDDLKGRVTEFTLGQLVALRFASDEELPDLARRVLDEKITSKDTIKKQIKNWQADFHRV
jgi:hypothetical protein